MIVPPIYRPASSAAGLAPGASTTVTLQFTATGTISDLLSFTTNGTP